LEIIPCSLVIHTHNGQNQITAAGNKAMPAFQAKKIEEALFKTIFYSDALQQSIHKAGKYEWAVSRTKWKTLLSNLLKPGEAASSI
jgi:hypothetical protein